MPQSNEKQREQAKLRMQKMRNKNSVTTDSVTKQGVTRIEFIEQVLNDDDLVKGIEAASLRFKDREARYEKAYRYNQWRAGKEIALAVPFAIVYDRDKTEKIYESLKTFRVSELVSYGCGHKIVSEGGVPFDVVGEYLEATR